MQGVERVDRELLDAEALVGHLVAPGSMFAFLASHRRDLFGDNEFEDLFPSGKGRPSIPASVRASILVLQTLHDLSDRETAEAARCDLRWKVATGMALDHAGFDPTTLVYWHKRLATSERPHRINEAVRAVVSQIASRGGRRLKLRYRGTVKNHAWRTRRTAALNLRNLIGRGLTRTAGIWVLAPQTA